MSRTSLLLGGFSEDNPDYTGKIKNFSNNLQKIE